MREFIDLSMSLLNKYSDALMVIITFIYVVATILICYFNYKSAQATRAQTEESRYQFDESKRLEMQPYLQWEEYQNSGHVALNLSFPDAAGYMHIHFCCRLKNVGHGSAINIVYQWGNAAPWENFFVRALNPGDESCFMIEFHPPKGRIPSSRDLILKYSDLLGHQYTQKVTFCYEYDTATCKETMRFSMDSPQHLT